MNTTPNTVEVIKKLREKVKDESELGEVVRSRRIDNENGNLHGYAREQKQIVGHAPVFTWNDDNKVTTGEYWERMRRSHIPAKYWATDSKGVDWSLYGGTYQRGITETRKLVNSYIAGFEIIKGSEDGGDSPGFRPNGIGLYINSKIHGSGKTLLACVTAGAIAKRFNTADVKYTTVSDYLELMKGKGDQRLERNKEYRRCTLLLLDEMGSDKTDWDKDILKNLISHRMSRQRPIIYISSCPIDELKGNSKTIALIKDYSKDIGLPPVNIRNKLAEQKKEEMFKKVTQKETTF